MAARRMASLWERRVSEEQQPSASPASPASPPSSIDSVDEPIRLDLDPFDETGAKKPRWMPSRRIRRGVSGKKPPVPPTLASVPFIRVAEEVPLSDNALLDGTSPVSSFLGSAPTSPVVADRRFDIPIPVVPAPSPPAAGVLEEIRVLRRKVKAWDARMDVLEEKNRSLSREIARLSAKFSRPRS